MAAASSSSAAPTIAAAAAAPEAKDGPVLRSKPVVAAPIEELEGLRVQEPPDGQSDGASKSPPIKDDVQGDDGEELAMEVPRCVPLGHRRVQLLAVHANFAVSTINIYDWHRGQTIYVSHNHQEVGRDLVLTGPRRPIGAYGTIGVEVYPLGSDLTGCGGRIIENLDPCDSVEDEDEDEDEDEYEDEDIDEDEPRICVQRIGRGSSRIVKVTYLFIPNTIEAEIKVELLPNPEVLGAYGYGVVSGTVHAWVSDYGRHCVRLFPNFTDEPCLSAWPGILFTLPLKPSIVCLPYRPHLKLHIEVDLMVVYGREKVSRIKSNLKFTPRVFGRLAEELDDHRIVISVHMDPDPLV